MDRTLLELRRLVAPFLVVAAALGATAPAQEVRATDKPFLWRIEGATPSYLFGTIHLPDDRVTTLHPAVTKAIAACDSLFTELPMDADTMIDASRLMVLPGRETLKDVLPEALYERLKSFLADRGMPIQPLSRFKVWAIATQVPLIDHLAKLASGEALDMLLYRTAREAGKTVDGLETIDEQIAVFDTLTPAQQQQLLIDALELQTEMDAKGEDPIEKIIGLYLAGDAEALMELMHETSSADEELQEQLEEAMLWSRNRRMAERIAARLREHPEQSQFFAVGAAHMPDDRGIVELLRREGLRLTRLPETVADVEAQIRALEVELQRLRERLAELRRGG